MTHPEFEQGHDESRGIAPSGRVDSRGFVHKQQHKIGNSRGVSRLSHSPEQAQLDVPWMGEQTHLPRMREQAHIPKRGQSSVQDNVKSEYNNMLELTSVQYFSTSFN